MVLSGRTDNCDSFIKSLLFGPSTSFCLYHWNLFEALWSMVCPFVPSVAFTGMIDLAHPFASPVPDAPGIRQVDHSALWIAEGALCLPTATAVACWLNMLWAAVQGPGWQTVVTKPLRREGPSSMLRDVAILQQLNWSRFSRNEGDACLGYSPRTSLSGSCGCTTAVV